MRKKLLRDDLPESAGLAETGMDLAVAGLSGLEGTLVLIERKRKTLLSIFPPQILSVPAGIDWKESEDRIIGLLKGEGVRAFLPASYGGIYGAIWDMAASSGLGLVADPGKIPILQETVEIAESLDIDPYRLRSGGAVVFAGIEGHRVVGLLRDAGVGGAVIGSLNGTGMRVLSTPGWDFRRFLELPRKDELDRALSGDIK